MNYGVFCFFYNLIVVTISAMNYLNAIVNGAAMPHFAIYPQAKTCQVGSDTGNLKGNSLKGCIAPWLILGRVNAQVVARKHVVIRQVNHTVITHQV